VVIETTGALLAGVWGNGREDFATLRLVGDKPDGELAPGMVEVEWRGALLAAGTVLDAAVLRRLAEVRVRGLLVGGLGPSLLPAARALDLPLVVVEGFGRRGFSEAAWTLLQSNAGREAWLNGAARDRLTGRRPELVVPLPSPSAAPPVPLEGQLLAAGKRVRVLRGPETGRVGMVAEVSDRPVLVASGLRVRTARVTFDGGSAGVEVPVANVELLE
jgi:hypothetical protein